MLEKILRGIQLYQNDEYKGHESLLKELAQGQHPSTLLMLSSDAFAHIPFNHIKPGNLFKSRNLGAIVPSYTESSNAAIAEPAAIEYAIKALGVQEIVLCAYVKNQSVEDTEKNVLLQMNELLEYPLVKEKFAKNELNVHAWVHEHKSGLIKVFHSQSQQFIPFEEAINEENNIKLSPQLKDEILHFKQQIYPQNKEHYTQLAKDHPKPHALVFGCSDSRLSLLEYMGLNPGEALMVRNVGNLIPAHSEILTREGALIEYAIEELGIEEIVVTGHSDCGAMKGLSNDQLEESLSAVWRWLSHANETREKIKASNGELSLKEITLYNVLCQVNHLLTYPCVQQKLKANQLKIHACYGDFVLGEMSMHDAKEGRFLSFRENLHKFLTSDELLAKVYAITQQEVLTYVRNMAVEPYKQLKPGLDALCNTGEVKGIWNGIHAQVEAKLWQEYGLFYPSREDERFTDLLDKAASSVCDEKQRIKQGLMNSPGYQRYSSESMRQHGFLTVQPQNNTEQEKEYNFNM